MNNIREPRAFAGVGGPVSQEQPQRSPMRAPPSAAVRNKAPTLSWSFPATTRRATSNAVAAAGELLSKLARAWEIILVDDGSTDNTRGGDARAGRRCRASRRAAVAQFRQGSGAHRRPGSRSGRRRGHAWTPTCSTRRALILRHVDALARRRGRGVRRARQSRGRRPAQAPGHARCSTACSTVRSRFEVPPDGGDFRLMDRAVVERCSRCRSATAS